MHQAQQQPLQTFCLGDRHTIGHSIQAMLQPLTVCFWPLTDCCTHTCSSGWGHSSTCVSTGDEYAQTRNGNNNWYGHDTKMTRFQWDQLEGVRDTFFRFYR